MANFNWLPRQMCNSSLLILIMYNVKLDLCCKMKTKCVHQPFGVFVNNSHNNQFHWGPHPTLYHSHVLPLWNNGDVKISGHTERGLTLHTGHRTRHHHGRIRLLISHHAICAALQPMAPMGTIALLMRILNNRWLSCANCASGFLPLSRLVRYLE